MRAGYGDVLTFSMRNPDWYIPLIHRRADWVCPHQVGDSLKELVWRVLGFLKEGIGQNAVGDIDATEFSADRVDAGTVAEPRKEIQTRSCLASASQK